MDDCQIPEDSYRYNIEGVIDIGDKLQNWLDTNLWIKKNFPDKRFQILVFVQSKKEAVYKTTVENWRKTIPINIAFFQIKKDIGIQGYFSPIKYMSLFFKANYYCNLCSETYDRYERHANKCPFRCGKCGRDTKEKCEIQGKLFKSIG